MIWNKYTIKTTTKDADLVSSVLMDYDIYDVQIENNVQLTDEELNQMYADFVKELPEDDGTCFVSFYFEFDDDAGVRKEQEEKLGRIREGLKEAEELFGIDPVEFEGEVVDSGDWENNWKQYFKPFTVDKFGIKPTWEPMPEEFADKTVIEIDPGMAFGTGLHETTRLCLRGLGKYMNEGDRAADFGCGSGILSIAALKLGCAEVNAVDIDPQATAVAAENFEVNGCDRAKYRIFTGNILEDETLKNYFKVNKCRILLANILAEIIAPLSKEAADYIAEGGYFITSGIINDKEELIVNLIRENSAFELTDVCRDGDWVSVIARRV